MESLELALHWGLIMLLGAYIGAAAMIPSKIGHRLLLWIVGCSALFAFKYL